jgi:imidazolonepropionase-like amidohydrolase
MRYVFANVKLIDGTSDHARESVDVAVQEDRISAVQPSTARDWPGQGYTVIDGHGKTLLPGLIDCHVHYTLDPLEPDFGVSVAAEPFHAGLVASRQAQSALFAGVTTARSAGAQGNLDFQLRDAIEAGRATGPRLLATGRVIGITGGHGYTFGLEADSPTEFVKAVRRQVRDGADVIKLMASEAAMLTSTGLAPGRQVSGRPEVTEEEAAAVVREAHRLDRRVLAHAQDSAAVVTAARAAVDSVEHAFLADDDAIRALADHGTVLVPTLVVTDVNRDRNDITADQRERQQLLTVRHRRSCETAISMGVTLATGTDTGEYGVSGDMLWREIVLLHDHGYAPMDAIKSATSTAAELLGVGDSVGSVQVGKLADLVLVANDPLQDLGCLARPELVMKGGVIYQSARSDSA